MLLYFLIHALFPLICSVSPFRTLKTHTHTQAETHTTSLYSPCLVPSISLSWCTFAWPADVRKSLQSETLLSSAKQLPARPLLYLHVRNGWYGAIYLREQSVYFFSLSVRAWLSDLVVLTLRL